MNETSMAARAVDLSGAPGREAGALPSLPGHWVVNPKVKSLPCSRRDHDWSPERTSLSQYSRAWSLQPISHARRNRMSVLLRLARSTFSFSTGCTIDDRGAACRNVALRAEIRRPPSYGIRSFRGCRQGLPNRRSGICLCWS
jgi:hypothetical protein